MATAWPGPGEAMEPRPGVPSPPAAGEAGRPWAALVFAGCGEREVALAKSFWNSVTLQPPLESRLGPRGASAGGGGSSSFIGARRGSAGGPPAAARRSCFDTQKSGLLAQASATSRKEETATQRDPEIERVDDQKAQYLQKEVAAAASMDGFKRELDKHMEHRGPSVATSPKAQRREEILALLRKQREERIMKEAISRPHRPKTKMEESKLKVPESDVEDQESVRALM